MSDNLDVLFEADDKKGATMGTNTAAGKPVFPYQSTRNSVADRLDVIGNTLFVIIIVLAVLATMVSCQAGIGGEGRGFLIGLALSVPCIIHVYIIKTLFNGFAELIQISHDTLREIHSTRKDTQDQ